MGIDREALVVTLIFLMVKAAHRKYADKPMMRVDDVVTAAQLYASIVTIRATPVLPLMPEVGKEPNST